jgi:hypothetical protein
VAKPFADEGQRRVLIIARNAADARLWAKVPRVTHVTDQMRYSDPNVPVIPFTPLLDRREKQPSPTLSRHPHRRLRSDLSRKRDTPRMATLRD